MKRARYIVEIDKVPVFTGLVKQDVLSLRVIAVVGIESKLFLFIIRDFSNPGEAQKIEIQ